MEVRVWQRHPSSCMWVIQYLLVALVPTAIEAQIRLNDVQVLTLVFSLYSVFVSELKDRATSVACCNMYRWLGRTTATTFRPQMQYSSWLAIRLSKLLRQTTLNQRSTPLSTHTWACINNSI